MVSYATFAAVLVVGLNLIGLNLQSVTVVAGALSVGIGFGLQNIVNNFVSGLILLFERPIRPGDWIRVGAVEGRVNRLSVRSTELRTADRAEVILPNGDLLTQPVTNLTRHDTQGRILLPLAVVHEADPAAVRELLLAAAAAHPLVLDAPAAEPQVLLRGFTEAAANFELRCVVRDVEQAQSVTSDLYFAVAEAFRSHGIALSFGQRDAWRPPAAAE
ncbi:MAG: mechanosensitive ion channel [Armatimonadetes bacterium]|nr:mechanosensitive ion channel [Armatimonadota bacterium]